MGQSKEPAGLEGNLPLQGSFLQAAASAFTLSSAHKSAGQLVTLASGVTQSRKGVCKDEGLSSRENGWLPSGPAVLAWHSGATYRAQSCAAARADKGLSDCVCERECMCVCTLLLCPEIRAQLREAEAVRRVNFSADTPAWEASFCKPAVPSLKRHSIGGGRSGFLWVRRQEGRVLVGGRWGESHGPLEAYRGGCRGLGEPLASTRLPWVSREPGMEEAGAGQGAG